MLTDIASQLRDGFVDWMQIDGIDGQDQDVGVARHWPGQPSPSPALFSNLPMVSLLPRRRCRTRRHVTARRCHCHQRVTPHDGWQSALAHRRRISTIQSESILCLALDYARQTKVLVVNDLERDGRRYRRRNGRTDESGRRGGQRPSPPSGG